MIAQFVHKKGLLLGSIFFSAVLLTSFTHVSYASVKRVSLEKSRWDGENRYLDVSLTCSGDDEPRVIRRSARASAKWCSVDVGSLCHRSKYTLARAVCKYDAEKFASLKARNAGAVQAVAQETGEPSANEEPSADEVAMEEASASSEQKRTELLREQMLIEEQRIEIEQQRLKLIAQEIELRKSLTSLAAAGD